MLTNVNSQFSAFPNITGNSHSCHILYLNWSFANDMLFFHSENILKYVIKVREKRRYWKPHFRQQFKSFIRLASKWRYHFAGMKFHNFI